LNRLILIEGELETPRVEQLILQYASFAITSNDPITLRFNSPGGNTHSTLEFARLIERRDVETIGIAEKASSGAALIFITCSKRYICKGGTISLHMPQFDNHFSIVDFDDQGTLVNKADVRAIQIWRKETLRILRSKLRISDEEFKKITSERSLQPFNPEQAVRLGLADEIVP